MPLLGHFGGRTDFDAYAFWTLENLGFGNLAMIRRRYVQVGEAVAERSRTMNQVRREVASALADAQAQRDRIEVARGELVSAEAGFRQDLKRIKGAAGLPIEVLDSLKLLSKARQEFIRVVTAYSQAQFALFVALGSPPPLASPTPAPRPAAPADAAPPPPPIIAARPAPAAPPTPTGRHEPAGPATQPTSLPESVAGPHPPLGEVPRALTAIDVELRESLTRLPDAAGAQDAGLRDGVAALARAHQDAMKAMLDYDRRQANLLKSLGGRAAPDRPDAALDELTELAESHRKLMESKLEYDRVLWRLESKLEYDRVLWRLIQTLHTPRTAASVAAPTGGAPPGPEPQPRESIARPDAEPPMTARSDPDHGNPQNREELPGPSVDPRK